MHARTRLSEELFAVALGGHRADRTGPAAPTEDEVEWVLESGFGPLLNHAAADRPQLIPRALRSAAQAADLTARVITAERLALIGALIDACAGRGIRLTLLKGISTCSELYAQPHWRTMGDVDLLVPAGALATVEARLRDLGCEQQARRPGFYTTHHHSAPFRHADTSLWIEVHTALIPSTSLLAARGPLSRDAWQQELRASEFEGRAVYRLSPELQLVYTANHWAEELKPLGGLFGLLDAALILQARESGLDWQKIAGWARVRPLGDRLRLALACLRRMGIEPPPPARQWLRRRGLGERVVAWLLWRLTLRFAIEGGRYGRLRSLSNIRLVWQNLIGDGGPWRRLCGLPLCLLFPPGRPDRFSFRTMRRRLASALGGATGDD